MRTQIQLSIVRCASARWHIFQSTGLLLALLWVAMAATTARGNTTFIPAGATWQYLDNGSNQGTAWRDAAFNDGAWKAGPAELGYGDGGEATVVGYAGTSTNKSITTYFRRAFTVEDLASFESMILRLQRDDGAVVYLNGVEILRSNMPAGTISYTTLASSAVAGADESTFFQSSIPLTHLLQGANVVAVELHQSNGNSSDLSFNMELTGVARSPAVTVLPAGSVWKYLDTGFDPGTQWINPGYNDTGWKSGAAQLGYGDGGETTVVSFGPSSTSKYITTYFRSAFDVADPAGFEALKVRLLRDDGAVVYLNGIEVHRSNMPSGTVTSSTLASVAVGGADESTFYESIVAANLLPGVNVLAVEVHQSDATSSDLSFDLELVGLLEAPAVAVTRGPYLQNATSTSMVIRWRTDLATSSTVWFGTEAASPGSTVGTETLTTEHEVAVSGLLPDTRYYYAIGSAMGAIASGPEYSFTTPPVPGSKQPFRVWVLGDSGTANADAAAVRNAYNNFNNSQYTDMWLMLGDNAYNNGTDSEFQAAVFNMYPAILRQSPLWSTLGNHEYYTSQGAPYFDIHTFPTQGEAGGVASGTERYYSFDYGNVHFICLDSISSDRSKTGPMATWLKADLESTVQDWIIAFWHHPPYTKGSHDSDNSTNKDLELVQMRENFLPLLEAGGVDLVLGGHSHSYERSYLIDGHYGYSQSFSPSMKIDGGNGREVDNMGAYRKPLGLAANQGAVYAVAGSSGKATFWWGGSTALVSPNPHPAMIVSLLKLGSLVLDVNDQRLDVKFLTSTGAVDDEFTLRKDIANSPPTVAFTSPAPGATVDAPVTLTATATPGPVEEGGSVEQVAFYAGDSLIGIVPVASSAGGSFQLVWNNPASGTHVLTATAWDDGGAQATSDPLTVTVNPPPNVEPTVTLTKPVTGASFEAPATVLLEATAADSDGTVAHVEFYNGATLLGTDATSPYSMSWNNVTAGSYVITAVALDDRGGSAMSETAAITVNPPPNVEPTVTLTKPVTGASFEAPATVLLEATAADSDGTVAHVEFYNGETLLGTDATSPYSMSWNNVPAGSHVITAVALDDRGGSATSETAAITVNPPPNVEPTVTLTKPGTGASFEAPATVLLEATAADSDGTVARVDFFNVDGETQTLLGTDATSPYSMSWNDVPAGSYVIKAVAIDDRGGSATSAAADIMIVEPLLPPAAPGNFTATANTTRGIDLSWVDNSGNETGFKIMRSTDSNFRRGVTTITVGANVTSYRDAGLRGGTLYYYRLHAYNDAGSSANVPASAKTSK